MGAERNTQFNLQPVVKPTLNMFESRRLSHKSPNLHCFVVNSYSFPEMLSALALSKLLA